MYSFDISFQYYFCSWTILKLYQYTPAAYYYYYYYEYITSTLRMLPLPQKMILCKCLTFLPTFSNVKLMHFALESFSYHGTEEGLILNQSLFFFIVFEKKKKALGLLKINKIWLMEVSASLWFSQLDASLLEFSTLLTSVYMIPSVWVVVSCLSSGELKSFNLF